MLLLGEAFAVLALGHVPLVVGAAAGEEGSNLVALKRYNARMFFVF